MPHRRYIFYHLYYIFSKEYKMNCCLILGMNEEINFLTKDHGPGENFLLRFVSLYVKSPLTSYLTVIQQSSMVISCINQIKFLYMKVNKEVKSKKQNFSLRLYPWFGQYSQSITVRNSPQLSEKCVEALTLASTEVPWNVRWFVPWLLSLSCSQ